MIARARRYRSADEAANEWARLGLDMPAAALGKVPDSLTLFVEGRAGDVAAAAEEARSEGLLASYSTTGHRPRLCVVGGLEDLEGLAAAPGLDVIARALQAYAPGAPEPMAITGGKLDFSRPLVMGVLNTTPDSFSDGGSYVGTDEGVLRALLMAEEGADIIDIGGESTRPGAEPVPVDVELQRVIPVIRLIAMQTTVPISIDTRKPEVASAALEAGAKIINDISGLSDPAMAEVAADNDAPVVLMHMLGDPLTMQSEVREDTYDDIVSDIMWFWEERMAAAEDAGLGRERIILDPGIGFGKLPRHNLEILDRSMELRSCGRPVLIGASRKGFIGRITGRPPEERLGGSLAAAAVAALNGASVLRVHDVKETVDLVRTIEAIRAGPK